MYGKDSAWVAKVLDSYENLLREMGREAEADAMLARSDAIEVKWRQEHEQAHE